MFFRKDKKEQHPLAEDSGSTPKGEADVQQDAARPKENPSAEEQIDYPAGVRLALVVFSVFVSMFLLALDRLIISTAIPAITDEFHSLPDVGWYGSAYLLTTCAFQLLFGKVYTFFSVKVTFLTTIFLFEAGSAIVCTPDASISAPFWLSRKSRLPSYAG